MITIHNRRIGSDQPVYFIADLAANHGGSLVKAKELIYACAESGVDAVKMQNFAAESIVSDYGFRHLQGVHTHQNHWQQSVFESYKAASIPLDWTLELKELAHKLQLHYLTSPYSLDFVKAVATHVDAFKLGSGDITWLEEISEMCRFYKPVLIATGASTMKEVAVAMEAALKFSSQLVLMQCNTEYTANINESREQRLQRFRYINLRVLETYARCWPGIALGLSDHTHGAITTLGAVVLFDCCVIEKHFTLDNSLQGQDHSFSMTPTAWLRMVEETSAAKRALHPEMSWEDRVRLAESVVDDQEALRVAIGDGVKRLECNEQNTVIVQRRAVRAARELESGHRLEMSDLSVLRPCPIDALPPCRITEVLNHTLARSIPAGDCIRANDII